MLQHVLKSLVHNVHSQLSMASTSPCLTRYPPFLAVVLPHLCSVTYSLGLPTCIPLTNAEFSAVTASFTFGGRVGSLLGNPLAGKKGRKGTIKTNAIIALHVRVLKKQGGCTKR